MLQGLLLKDVFEKKAQCVSSSPDTFEGVPPSKRRRKGKEKGKQNKTTKEKYSLWAYVFIFRRPSSLPSSLSS
jgi:hypothetical protein